MEAIFSNLRTNSKTKHQGIRCLKYFEINFNASNRVEQGCRAQMSGTRKLKTGSHLAGSKKNDIFLRQQVGQWNYYGQIMTSHTVCRSICSQVPWSRLWKVAVAMHWQCKDARKTQWVWKCMQHVAKHPSTQTSKPFAAGISFLILFDIHHNAVRVWYMKHLQAETTPLMCEKERIEKSRPIVKRIPASCQYIYPSPLYSWNHLGTRWPMKGNRGWWWEGVSRVYIFLDFKCFPYRATKYQTCTCTGYW